MKKMVGIIAISIFACTMPTSGTAAVVDAGNKMCPISGEEVTGKHFVEHGGKKYGLCCAGCAKKFKKNPEKYLKEMSEGRHHHEGHH